MKRRPDPTPTFWIGNPPPMLPRGQMDLPLVQAPAEEPRTAHTLRACVKCNAPRCALYWCEFCKRLPATVESVDGDGFACDGCRDRRDVDFGCEAGVAWRALR